MDQGTQRATFADTEQLRPPPELPGQAELGRKRSMVRPERRRLDPTNPQFHYQQVALNEAGVSVQPSKTGHEPLVGRPIPLPHLEIPEERLPPEPTGPYVPEDAAADKESSLVPPRGPPIMPKESGRSLWEFYCRALTFPVLPFMMRPFGMKTRERQMAWREKIGLITVILACGAFVGYLTFGFTQSVCSDTRTRIHHSELPSNNLAISGSAFDFGQYVHPAVLGVEESPILYPPVNAGGMDGSFMFQNVNGHCQGLILPYEDSSIPFDMQGRMGYYFPCRLINRKDNSLVALEDTVDNHTSAVYEGWGCHTSALARSTLYRSNNQTAVLFFRWDELTQLDRQLVVYNGDVLDLGFLDHLLVNELTYPPFFDELRRDTTARGLDISQRASYGHRRKELQCLRQLTKVGEVDTEAIGCIASQIVLYTSLVFILGLVVTKFVLACYFRFVMAPKQGAFAVTNKEFAEHEERIEDWTADIYKQAPLPPASSKRKSMLLSKLRPTDAKAKRRVTMVLQNPHTDVSKVVPGGSVYNQPVFRQSVYDSRSSTLHMDSRSPVDSRPNPSNLPSTGLTESVEYSGAEPDLRYPPAIFGQGGGSANSLTTEGYPSSHSLAPTGPMGSASEYFVPQPPADYQPFGYPLVHTICLVTAYSESVEGLRTTFDSLATTEYPNSHKMLLVVCDGLIKGSGNTLTTPEICLSMMHDFAIPQHDVQAYSYVSVVAGAKRQNMAKVYAGFYKYDDSTVAHNQQQRIPMICVVKCGTPQEADKPKPGNRGKRDSQIVVMSFLERIMFDERMTELEFEIFNGILSVTGIAPDFYEVMLMVDADTKVFPDCLTHMVAEMVKDSEIMGLCGETKIANKTESWVSMIQVFEYFISHHQAKAFESVFGGVTCLPGCFSMYRIKSPKGAEGYWVPILANPDIVERYSDNVIDTLHQKNLLLLGEDRYLSSLMLKTFPKRKMMFLPKAACKTIVPASFRVLLSQRRRWINSTIHNLMELLLVRDLCGVFIISMQFVVFIDLVSTLVLPAAISFTVYIIVFAITSKPTPIMSLVLLALILGLPGLLIIVTATRVSYVLWMLIYLLALPIWNFVLPMYAYWKFDDFSWGETRSIEGGEKGGHDEHDGEFDSSRIVMKRWREFQRDRQNIYERF